MFQLWRAAWRTLLAIRVHRVLRVLDPQLAGWWWHYSGLYAAAARARQFLQTSNRTSGLPRQTPADG